MLKESFFEIEITTKVQLFWGGHKNLRSLRHGFDIKLVNFKTIRQIFVAFSENLNFTQFDQVGISEIEWCTSFDAVSRISAGIAKETKYI